MESEIIGHEKILKFFDKVIKSGNLGHAYCLIGMDNLGKRAVTESISAQLLKLKKEKLLTCPDFFFVSQELNQKTGKTKKNIDISQIRKLRQFLSGHAFLGGYKIAIIDNAEKMNVSAANALLKTLEEPTAKTIIFLITKNEESLPETIISRSQLVYFKPVDKSKIEKALVQMGLDEKGADEMSRLSLGLPGRALVWFKDPESFENYKNEVARFTSLLGEPFYKKMKNIEDLFGDKSDHIATRANLQKVLDVWQLLIRDKIFNRIGLSDNTVHKIDSDTVIDQKESLSIMEVIQEAKILLDQNIHPRLLLTKILIKLP